MIAPADLDRAQREWSVLGPILDSPSSFAARFPEASLQAVHGDGPAHNGIRTKNGILFGDFEDVNYAPVEWDLALTTPAEVERYNRQAVRRGARSLDMETLRIMNAARMLQIVGAMALAPQLPALATLFTPLLAAWRGMPFAGGLA